MTQLRTSAEWRLFSFNWVPIGLMAVVLALGLAFTDFSLKPASIALGLCVAALYAIVAYYNAHAPHKRDPIVVFGGGHFFVDVFAGIAVAVLAIVAARWIGQRLTEPAAQSVLATQTPVVE